MGRPAPRQPVRHGVGQDAGSFCGTTGARRVARDRVVQVLGSFRAGDVTAETWRTIARDARIDPDELLLWARETCGVVADVVQEQIRALPDADRSDVTERLNRRIRIRSTTAARAIR